MYDSAGILKIFMDFYWIRMDSLQFPLMSLGFHLMILSYPMNFLDFLGFLSRSYGRLWIYLVSVSISMDFHKFPSQFLLFFYNSKWFLLVLIDLSPVTLDFFGFPMEFCGFVWVCMQFQLISFWFVTTPYGFLWICIQFQRLSYWFASTSYWFLWIFMDVHGPAISVEFLRISLPLVRRSAAEHARDGHNRASRKLHESVLLGCLVQSLGSPARPKYLQVVPNRSFS